MWFRPAAAFVFADFVAGSAFLAGAFFAALVFAAVVFAGAAFFAAVFFAGADFFAVAMHHYEGNRRTLVICPLPTSSPQQHSTALYPYQSNGPYLNRSRIGPFAVDGSTTCPACVITISPRATIRRAAARAGSISGCQLSGLSASPIALAASLGQIVFPAPRSCNSCRIFASIAASAGPGFFPRHASLQNLTPSQSRSHFFRHSIVRPQAAQLFAAGTPLATLRSRTDFFRSGIC